MVQLFWKATGKSLVNLKMCILYSLAFAVWGIYPRAVLEVWSGEPWVLLRPFQGILKIKTNFIPAGHLPFKFSSFHESTMEFSRDSITCDYNITLTANGTCTYIFLHFVKFSKVSSLGILKIWEQLLHRDLFACR